MNLCWSDQKSDRQLENLSIRKFSTFIISIDNGSESLLASGVPDLQFDYFVIDIDRLESEIDPNGDHIILIELIISEPKEER